MHEYMPHKTPPDLKHTLTSTPDTLTIWKSLTPLARNEWICWVTSAKKTETRIKRIKQLTENLRDGKRRPCCWPGCPHR